MSKVLLAVVFVLVLLSGCAGTADSELQAETLSPPPTEAVPAPTETPKPTPEPYWPADAVMREQQYGRTVWTEGRLFFLWEGKIWCYEEETGRCREICEADAENNTWLLSADGEKIWFYRDGMLCSVNTDGEELREIQPTDGTIYAPRAIEGNIFWFSYSSLRRLNQETETADTAALLSSHMYILEEAAGADENWFYYAEMDSSPDTRQETGKRLQTTIYRVSLSGWGDAEEWLVLPEAADTNFTVFGKYAYFIRYLEPEPPEDGSVVRAHNQLYRYDTETEEEVLIADYAYGYWFAESGIVVLQEDAQGIERLVFSDPQGNSRELLQVEFDDGTWNVPLGTAGDRLLYAARDDSFRLMELSGDTEELVFSLPSEAE